MTNTKQQVTSLITALENQIVPWVERWGISQMYTALPSWADYQRLKPELPEGSWITPQPLKSKRQSVYGQRAFGKTSIVNATWHEDGLQSARSPRLNFVLSGNVAIQLGDYVYHCRAGHTFLIPPDIPFPAGDKPHFEMSGTVEKACEMFMLLPHYKGVVCWTNREWLDGNEKTCIDQALASLVHSNVSLYLLRLVEEIMLTGKYQTFICDHLLGLIVTTLHRELKNNIPTIRAGTLQPERIGSQTLPQKNSITLAQDYIQRHLRYPLTIEDVSRQVYMSRTIFTARFREKTGKSFNEFVNDCRLEEAKSLLSNTDVGILQIAAQVGLKPSRMRALFHQRLGISPADYRNQSNTNKRLKVATDGQ